MRGRLPDRYQDDSVRMTQALKVRRRTASVPDSSMAAAAIKDQQNDKVGDLFTASRAVDMRRDARHVLTEDDALLCSFTAA